MNRYVVIALRIVLPLILLGAVLMQVLIPITAAEEADIYAEVEPVALPYSIAADLAIACGQVIVVMTWKLLSLVARGSVFAVSSLRWVDVIIAAGALATLLTLGVAVHLGNVAEFGGPIVLGLSGLTVIGIAFVMIMLVLRSLLGSATAYRAELDEVI